MSATKILNFRNFIPNAIFSVTIFRKNFPLCNFSVMNSKNFSSFNNFNKSTTNLNLIPPNPLFIPSCGFKVKGKLKRRCKDCYVVRLDGKMMILCDSYPRHKQVQQYAREKFSWILTHCCQSKKRPY